MQGHHQSAYRLSFSCKKSDVRKENVTEPSGLFHGRDSYLEGWSISGLCHLAKETGVTLNRRSDPSALTTLSTHTRAERKTQGRPQPSPGCWPYSLLLPPSVSGQVTMQNLSPLLERRLWFWILVLLKSACFEFLPQPDPC